MTVIRVEKNSNYTTMSNYHLRDQRLSLKAKGLLSMCLSLPDGWDYSIQGLTAITKEGRTVVMSTLQELEEAGYLVREQTREPDGKLGKAAYTVYEFPHKRKAEVRALQPEHQTGADPGFSANPFDLADPQTGNLMPEGRQTEQPQTGKSSPGSSQLGNPSPESPQTGNPQSEKPWSEMPQSEKPWSENPTTGNPTTGNPMSENRTQLNTDRLNKDQLKREEKERLQTAEPVGPVLQQEDRSVRQEDAKKGTEIETKKDTRKGTEQEAKKDTKEDTQEDTQKDTQKVTKKESEVRHRYGRYQNVLLTDADLLKLREEFPVDYKKRIERLSEYIASTGKSYRNHLATIRSWARRDYAHRAVPAPAGSTQINSKTYSPHADGKEWESL